MEETKPNGKENYIVFPLTEKDKVNLLIEKMSDSVYRLLYMLKKFSVIDFDILYSFDETAFTKRFLIGDAADAYVEKYGK